MSTINSFNRDNIKNVLRPKLEELLQLLEMETGIKVEVGTISFSSDSASVKIRCIAGNSSDDQRSIKQIEAEKDWNMYCEMYGFKKEDLNKSIADPSIGKVKIVGLLPNRRKNNILLEANGKQYVSNSQSVLLRLKNSK